MQQEAKRLGQGKKNSSNRQKKQCSKPQTKPKASKRIATSDRKKLAARSKKTGTRQEKQRDKE